MIHPHLQAPGASFRPRRRRATVAALVLLPIAVLAVTGSMLVRAPVEEYVIDLGPIALPAGSGHHDVPQPAPQTIPLPFNGWFRGFTVEIVDERGQPVPKELLHHVNLIVPERRELFSPIMLRLGAAGPETRPIKLPGVLGYRIRQGDSLLVTAMLHNPTGANHEQALVRVHLAYTPVSGWLRPLGIYPFYLDVMPPAGIHAYDLPPGRSEQSWEGRPAVGGRVIGLGGHLHRYSVALRFEDVTAQRVLWEATPTTDDEGHVIAMPRKYFLPFGIRINADHVYRLTAMYDNPTADTIPGGGMGALGGAFMPDDAGIWPQVETGHPDYQFDLRITTGEHRQHTAPGPNEEHGTGTAHSH